MTRHRKFTLSVLSSDGTFSVDFRNSTFSAAAAARYISSAALNWVSRSGAAR
eukprot:CAMPEP_0196752248 /NCGR_PEP_ID=MMETSP1091-20130531/86519_1 /TAXON_ID=302021 /ORGANISM="Rhodomonas sp., Strain CCMP768" /LENGTH=51 /DNA_ID=CAMNT_0042100163 /DNA_START=94 /DNA_END=246 /DNA_ORIENTATION=-